MPFYQRPGVCCFIVAFFVFGTRRGGVKKELTDVSEDVFAVDGGEEEEPGFCSELV
jgi:hypothetical protein